MRTRRGDWNACGTVGDDNAEGPGIDDVRFLTSVVDKLVTEIGIDPDRTFAAGSSRGGFMALRLALEAPSRFRAVAAVSANVHTPDNFKCKPAQSGTSSVMIMNGTEDPLVPFDGGNVNLLGFSYKYGKVMSSRTSAQYFADLNHLAGAPETKETSVQTAFASSTCFGATTPKKWSSLPFTAVGMASPSRIAAIRDCWAHRRRSQTGRR